MHIDPCACINQPSQKTIKISAMLENSLVKNDRLILRSMHLKLTIIRIYVLVLCQTTTRERKDTNCFVVNLML